MREPDWHLRDILLLDHNELLSPFDALASLRNHVQQILQLVVLTHLLWLQDGALVVVEMLNFQHLFITFTYLIHIDL